MPQTEDAAEARAPDDRADDQSRADEPDRQDEPDGQDRSADVAAQLEDQLRRALADLDNLRKRYQRDLERERAAERARLAAAWLPVVDNLELALRHTNDDAASLVEGVRAVHEQAVATLTRLGFPRFESVGETFDPAVHEAVSTVNDEAPSGTVVAVVRPGYGTPEALLRPAGVVVATQ